MKKGLLFSMFSLGILFSMDVSVKALNKIKLYTTIDSFYTIYETKLAIIYLNNNDIIKLLSSHIKSEKLCDKQKEHYSNLLRYYSLNEKVINYIIIPTYDASLSNDLSSPRKTGFAPLDFFTSLTWLDLSQPYIPPYGYKTTYTDSANYSRLDTLYKSVVNELLLNGAGRVFNKTAQLFEETIYLEELDFHDGHGGRNFLFQNKEMFYNLDWYGDAGGAFDPECE